MQITTIGLDIAKNVFQVHGIDATERVVVRKQLRRGQVLKFFAALPPCLVGMEACATAHHWARELTKLGHEVRLMPAKDVKAYVKRKKNDAADAEAICEAVRRPTMRFVRAKSAEQQGRLMQHRARDLLLRQQTQVINALRAHLAELGIVAAKGREGLKELLTIIADESDERLPIDARASLILLAAQLQALHTMISSIERRLTVQHRASEESERVATVPGIGTLGASAITATVTDASAFRSGRDFLHLEAEYMAAPVSFRERSDSFPLHRGRRPYMARKSPPRTRVAGGGVERDFIDVKLGHCLTSPSLEGRVGYGITRVRPIDFSLPWAAPLEKDRSGEVRSVEADNRGAWRVVVVSPTRDIGRAAFA
jgi:transposase